MKDAARVLRQCHNIQVQTSCDMHCCEHAEAWLHHLRTSALDMHSDLSCGRSDHQIASSRRLDITLILTEKDAFIDATIALV